MAKKIISVSRRTDIPAYYGQWFQNCIKAGYAGYINPFSKQPHLVSLKKEDVECFVFWSRNYTFFMDTLENLGKGGYNFYFNYTLTGLPKPLENTSLPHSVIIRNIQQLSQKYSPEHITWRYDPILLSSISDYSFHINKFTQFAAKLEGYINRCHISFPSLYKKVQWNLTQLEKEKNIKLIFAEQNFQKELADKISAIAKNYGISTYSCCNDFLADKNIKKSRCIDSTLIHTLFNSKVIPHKQSGTRDECGCCQSTDIGAYNSCPHNCSYCYANINHTTANTVYSNHDPNSTFLGTKKETGDILGKKAISKTNNICDIQGKLF